MEIISISFRSTMANPYFKFKKFTIYQDKAAMKVTTDACLFGAWCASELNKLNTKNKNALDIGTGTGLLAMMVAQKTMLTIDAVEIDVHASQQAKQNIEASPFANAITLHSIDIAYYSKTGYDYIISNPPFYEDDLASPVQIKNIAHHSSNLSFQELFIIINKKLNENGLFFLLLPYKRIDEIENLITKNFLHIHTLIEVKQTYNHSPFRIMICGGKTKKEMEKQEIIIKTGETYSNDFINLLKDYYLYL